MKKMFFDFLRFVSSSREHVPMTIFSWAFAFCFAFCSSCGVAFGFRRRIGLYSTLRKPSPGHVRGIAFSWKISRSFRRFIDVPKWAVTTMVEIRRGPIVRLSGSIVGPYVLGGSGSQFYYAAVKFNMRFAHNL